MINMRFIKFNFIRYPHKYPQIILRARFEYEKRSAIRGKDTIGSENAIEGDYCVVSETEVGDAQQTLRETLHRWMLC